MSMNHTTSGAPPQKSIAVRTSIPEAWSVALDHLALDLGLTKQTLLQDGALLVLRYFSRAEGLGEPMSAGIAVTKGVLR